MRPFTCAVTSRRTRPVCTRLYQPRQRRNAPPGRDTDSRRKTPCVQIEWALWGGGATSRMPKLSVKRRIFHFAVSCHCVCGRRMSARVLHRKPRGAGRSVRFAREWDDVAGCELLKRQRFLSRRLFVEMRAVLETLHLMNLHMLNLQLIQDRAGRESRSLPSPRRLKKMGGGRSRFWGEPWGWVLYFAVVWTDLKNSQHMSPTTVIRVRVCLPAVFVCTLSEQVTRMSD